MANEIELTGCTPEPLMSYLKALGVFRLVAEQADANACLSWRGGTAVLRTALNQETLVAFFVETYIPTPVVAPWNGGSGFYGGGSDALLTIEQSTSSRLGRYRDAISRARSVVPKTKPKDEDKESLLIRCRSVLGDEVVPWLDSCFVLQEEGAAYFPLLGTGGNDGRLDFTNNFMQRTADVVTINKADRPPSSTQANLRSSLFGDTLVCLGTTAIGQFNPGGIGGPNGIQGKFEAASGVNPWDYVLMIEGALFFAGSIGRRLGSTGSSRSVFPFVVDSVAVGYGSSTTGEETTDGSRAELWLPLWRQPATYFELQHLMSEGRAQLDRRQARNAVEFALSVNLLGVDRGVDSFVRFGFLKRNGLAFLATPLGRIEVKWRPDARLLDDPPLREWSDRLRRGCSDKEKTPHRYQAALRSIHRAMFSFASRSEIGNDAPRLLEVLRAVGRAELTLAHGITFAKSKYIRPLSSLNSQWVSQANDGSPEFRLAASLAGIASANGKVGPLRAQLEQVSVTKFVNWNSGNTSAVWSHQPLANNLAAVFRRRQLESFQFGVGRGVPIDSYTSARLDDVLAFLNGQTDDGKLADLLWGLICVDPPKESLRFEPSVQDIPFEFSVPRLLVNSLCVAPVGRFWNIVEGTPNAEHDPDVFHHLATDRTEAVSQCVTRAARRLKAGGLLAVGYRNRQHARKRKGETCRRRRHGGVRIGQRTGRCCRSGEPAQARRGLFQVRSQLPRPRHLPRKNRGAASAPARLVGLH